MTAAESAVQAALERAKMLRAISDVQHTVADLAEALADHRAETKELLEAFRNATFALSAVKWIGGTVIAVGAAFAAISPYWQSFKKMLL